MISLAEFCTCGSLIIEGRCSNKGCSFKTEKPAYEKGEHAKKNAKSGKEPAKSTKTKRASKCITYNLYDDSIKDER